MEYVNVPYETYRKMIDLDIAKFVKKNPFNKMDYLPWSAAGLLLKQHFPTYCVTFETDNEGVHEFFDVPNRGTYVRCYIVDKATGARSECLDYPVMSGKAHKAVIEPDVREITDAKARAAVKLIAIVTGIGLNLWLREEEQEIEKGDEGEEVKTPRRRGESKTFSERVRSSNKEDEEENDEEEDDEEEETKPQASRRRRPVEEEEEEERTTKRRSTGAMPSRRRRF